LVAPTAEDRAWVEQVYGEELPSAEGMQEIEESARYYEDNNGLHLHSFFLHTEGEQTRNVTVAFVLREGRLFTLHDEDSVTFRVFRMRARRQPGYAVDGISVLLGLLETKVERLADTLEIAYATLETTSQSVLRTRETRMEEVLSELAGVEDVTAKARLSLMDKQRALSFLLRIGKLDAEQAQRARAILRDIESLTAHLLFLFERVGFLMDATMGLINIEQNKIIKIFSIAAGVLLPPTLIASIYGMNFDVMPELHWAFGYPYALLLIVVSAVAPYLYFKHKGWL
jgi:magnesium transporter